MVCIEELVRVAPRWAECDLAEIDAVIVDLFARRVASRLGASTFEISEPTTRELLTVVETLTRREAARSRLPGVG